MAIATLNPATGKLIKTFESLSDSQIDEKLNRSTQIFFMHRKSKLSDNARKMVKAAEILEAEKEKFGRMMTEEMGKPLAAAIQEVEKCALNCRFYAENAEKFLSEERVKTDPGTDSFIRYQPLGVILAVMPWNFPFWQVFRFASPAIMAGNVGLLKHSSNVPQCALAIEDIFKRAGFHPDIFQTLLIGSEKVKQVIEDPRVAAVTLTGSVPAGSQVGSIAGKALKKTVLELGGSDPFIVLPSASLDEAVMTGVKARTINSGQSCIAAKRFIVAQSIAAEFEMKFVKAMESLKVGDPMDLQTQIGPLATEKILLEIDQQVKKSVEMGAKLLTGGYRLKREGYFYAPTVLSQIPKSAPAFREEIFGPVASVFTFSTPEEAIQIANDSEFGLGASVWTRDKSEQMQMIEEIQSGTVCVNGMVVSDPRMPFGGIKNSGYGRELSYHGIREFVNIKTVMIRHSAVHSHDSE
jgi:succinate-semialdehyde dehydrogenase / glutarate-semialdehyde dehydrogenase